MSINERAGQSLAKQVPAAETGTVELPVQADGTIESIKLRIYTGAENTLKLRPQKKTDRGFEDILDLAGKNWIDGDDDVWSWSLSVPIQSDEKVVIRYDNQDGANAHNFRATVDVDYLGGLERVSAFASDVTDRIGGVLG